MLLNEECSNVFEEKVVIITGAAKGIGRATALEFSRRGANVVIVDILEKQLREADETIQKLGKKVLSLRSDVSDAVQVEEVIKKVLNEFGNIDILINNAGIIGPLGPIVNLAEEDWEKIFRINVKSTFLFCKNVIPIMVKNRKGNIVNIASIAGKEAAENGGAYSASKAAVICLSRVLAKELGKDGIRVNCIAPALIKTEMLSSLPQEMIDISLAKTPLGRMGYPEEVADLVLFLCSEKASFITGHCYNITGGRGEY